jgi:hypothetical protein
MNEGESPMENLETTAGATDPNSMETAPPETAAVDLQAARKAIENAEAVIREQKKLIVTEELRLAVESQQALATQCRSAQDQLENLNREIEKQTHVAYQGRTREKGAQMATQQHRENSRGPSRYPTRSELAEWQAGLVACLEEENDARSAAAAAFGELSRLQGERRAIVRGLEETSWQEGASRQSVFGLRKKLAQLVPRPPIVPSIYENPPEDRVMMELSGGGLTSLPGVKVPDYGI